MKNNETESLFVFYDGFLFTFTTHCEAKIGKTLTVLVDEIDTEENIAICRSYADAPEIDGHVYVDDIDATVTVGQFVTVTIDDASEYDLFASYKG